MTGDDLRDSRLWLGLTQAELARVLDVPQSTVSRWERGDMQIRRPEWVAHKLSELERERVTR